MVKRYFHNHDVLTNEYGCVSVHMTDTLFDWQVGALHYKSQSCRNVIVDVFSPMCDLDSV